MLNSQRLTSTLCPQASSLDAAQACSVKLAQEGVAHIDTQLARGVYGQAAHVRYGLTVPDTLIPVRHQEV